MTPVRRQAARATERYHVPNLERALRILEHLAELGRPCGISDIADRLKLPKNSVFRIVSTLHAHGYLKRDDSSKQFALGSKLLSLGYAALHEGHLVERSLDIMRQLRDEIDETILLGILDGPEGVVLESVPSHQQVKVVIGIGTRFPLHTAAPAKAMMAHLPADERDHLLDQVQFTRYTDRTLTTRQSLLADIEASRRRGYALDQAEHNDGIRCVAAPILNQRGYPVGAVWVTGPAFRFTPDRFEDVGPRLAAAAARISSRFGHDTA
jgi:DNA-binding IclR family transcriptional regulator